VACSESFGERVRNLREEKKKTDPTFSLRQFAEKLKLTPTYISKIERGEFRPPSPETIKKMAVLLGADSDELLELAGKVDPELGEIIKEQPRAMADFLRTAREKGLTSEDIREITERIRQGKKPWR